MKYTEFLRNKISKIQHSGFDIDGSELNPMLFDFQKFIVQRALKNGKYAVFADCGLGKTPIQLEWANQISKRESAPVLILAPLAVSGQTIQEGVKFNIPVQRWENMLSVKREKDCLDNYPYKPGIYITNYEQLDNIDVKPFIGIVLDESSILKNFEGKTKETILETFADTKYKLACTATPSPNDPMEIGNHSKFLDIMGRNEMLSMYFVHDGGDTGKWRIKRHAIDIFYEWISTWAVMCNKPSDIGFSNKGFDLPSLNFIENEIKTEKRNNGELFNSVAVSATNFNQELRLTIIDRLDKVKDIVNSDKENYIIWTKQNTEGDYLKKSIPEIVEVKGNDSKESKEDKLLGFAHNKFRLLNTKSKIAQFGLNYQNCHNQVFASLDFSFEALYQSIRRSYRFGQTHPVNIYMITTDTMQNVIKSIKQKEKKFKTMQDKMAKAISKNIKEGINIKSINSMADVKTGRTWLMLGDCIGRIKEIPDSYCGFSIFSPPFADLYTYSDKINDMGNSSDWQEFMKHFAYLVPELSRVMMPGRNIAVHCMDLPIQKGREGYIGLRDFSGMLISLFQSHGFILHCKITIWKDPVIEMQRTKALGLLHKQLKKDAIMSRVGIPDYLLVFRNKGENQIPVPLTIPVDIWQKWASPIWYDIKQSNTLQHRSAREEKDEKHLCPLQLDTIERTIALWSNPGEWIIDTFGGIGSTGHQALKMDRKSISIELKESYYNVNVRNHNNSIESKNQILMFP